MRDVAAWSSQLLNDYVEVWELRRLCEPLSAGGEDDSRDRRFAVECVWWAWRFKSARVLELEDASTRDQVLDVVHAARKFIEAWDRMGHDAEMFCDTSHPQGHTGFVHMIALTHALELNIRGRTAASRAHESLRQSLLQVASIFEMLDTGPKRGQLRRRNLALHRFSVLAGHEVGSEEDDAGVRLYLRDRRMPSPSRAGLAWFLQWQDPVDTEEWPRLPKPHHALVDWVEIGVERTETFLESPKADP